MTPWFKTSLLLCALLASSASAAVDRYAVQFSEGLERVDVQLCFHGKAPDRLYRHEAAAQHASAIQFGEKTLTARNTATRMLLPELPPNACLTWHYELTAAAAAMDYATAYMVGDSVVAETALWFWKGPRERPVEVRVSLPAGQQLSSPWPRDEGDPTLYRPEPTATSWTSRSAIGPFTPQPIPLAGGQLELTLLGVHDAATAHKLRVWVEESAAATSSVFGHFPRAHTQVLVVALGPRSEPVPWAHVIRGGGAAVQFYVDETRPLEEFRADWTATHEFSHLLLPFVARDDRWLSEGMASYYQNVLRARDGRLTERQAWQAMEDGFQRGRDSVHGDTLREASRSGWRSTRRVYWSGAAMMLEADMRLRRQTAGTKTLDTALRALHDCCFDAGKRWFADELLQELDRLNNTDVFMSVYAEHIEARNFPDLSAIYQQLGVERLGGAIQLSDSGPESVLRAAIMQPAAAQNPAASARDSAP
ncbi:MAG: hypothetical protein HRU51_12265 [Xanthomonadales bacterium]|nr:hypothetical protein [Xanthomonadales bacterium]